MKLTRLLPAVFLSVPLLACSGGGGGRQPGPSAPEAPPSSFLVPLGPTGGPALTDAWGGTAPLGAPGEGQAAPAPGDAAARVEIQESDVYQVDGSLLYLLNAYRGLQIVDLSDPEAPALVGAAPVYGRPVEMHRRGKLLLAVVSGGYVRQEDGSPAPVTGDRIVALDVSDPAAPRAVGEERTAGEVVDSRLVGDHLYVVSHRWTGAEGRSEALSLALAEPGGVRVADRKEFVDGSWDHHLFVNDHAIYVASSGSSGFPGPLETRIRYLDITDPAGSIQLRGSAVAPGRVLDRWSVDEHQGVLRVASAEGWGNGDVYLTTFSVADPDRIAQLGSATLQVNEQLTAARFDGTRGYLVSVARIDPLFAFDLSDPANPNLLGELEMTGWLDYLAPFGDRLIALGHDQTAAGGTTLAVSLIDTAGATPALLSRVHLGEEWASTPGNQDDVAKVFKLLPDRGLALIPFQSWDSGNGATFGGVQLLDYDAQTLTLRGLAAASGWVDRAVPWNDTTLLTLSSELLQVMDVADRDAPALRARLELVHDVRQVTPFPGGAAALLWDLTTGESRLRTFPPAAPDAAAPLAEIRLPLRKGRLFLNGSVAYVVGLRAVPLGQSASVAVQVVDLADPAVPALRGSLSFAEAPPDAWVAGWRPWGAAEEVVQLGADVLAFHRSFYPVFPFEEGPAGPENAVYLLDLENPDEPRLAKTVALPSAAWSSGLKAQGTTLYLSDYETVVKDGEWYARYSLRRIEAADPYQPVVRPAENVPGAFVAASPTGGVVYTLASWWDRDAGRQRSQLHALTLTDRGATLESTAELQAWVTSVKVEGETAVAVSTDWVVTVQPIFPSPPFAPGQTKLVCVDLSDPKALRVSGEAEAPVGGAWLQEVSGGRAFLGSEAGLLVYRDLRLPQPTFESSFPLQGTLQDLVVDGDKAYVATGLAGARVLTLGTE